MWSYLDAAEPLTSGRLGQHLLFRRGQQGKAPPQRFLDDPPLMHPALGSDLPDGFQQLWIEFYEHRLARSAARLPGGHIHRGTRFAEALLG